MAQAKSHNMKLLAQETLQGFGGVGEGVALQVAKDGRRILWVAHEGPPKNFSGIDVSDPRNPRLIVQTELPHTNMRSNSLELSGDTLAIAYQTYGVNIPNAGIELFDISDPENPRSISFFNRSGEFSRGCHVLWFIDGEYIHCASGAPDFKPSHPNDDQFYQIIDVRNPSKPEEVGRWWLPGTKDGEEPLPRLHTSPSGKDGYRPHNTNVYPERPDRCYVGYLDGGMVILDIADKANPKLVSQWNPHPPYPGFTHTALPLLDRDLVIATDESIVDDGADWPKLTWVLDIRDETNPVSISTFPLPAYEEHANLGGRFGSHNLHENLPGASFRSNEIIIGTYFNAGVRAFDISNPYRPEEVAHFVPPKPENSRVDAAQINDVFVDENCIVYAVERIAGGIYILEMDV